MMSRCSLTVLALGLSAGAITILALPDIRWVPLSSQKNQLPVPGQSTQQARILVPLSYRNLHKAGL